jgi:hypothetical protein
MQKLKTPLEKSEEIFKRNLTKRPRPLFLFWKAMTKQSECRQFKYIIEKVTSKPVIIVVNDSKKKFYLTLLFYAKN